MKLRTLLTSLLLLIAGATPAVTTGYYRIKSNLYGRYVGENYSSHQLYTTTSNSTTDYSLVWYITSSGSIKNALTDRYVQRQGNYSSIYSTGTSSVNFTISQSGSTYTISDYSGAGLHCAETQNYDVVHWSTNADASVWQIESVTVNSTELANQKAALTAATTSQLTQFFTSTACTELKSTYTSYSDANLRSAMSALPTTVQDLAVKIKNNSWTTYSGWTKTEKTFRIADYKAYSNHDRWKSIFGFKNYTMGRLSNPTGIWANDGDILQVYVGAIPSGQNVKLEVAGYGQAYGMQYPLSQGMNCLKISNAGNCFVNYEVDNTSNGGTPYKLMSNYADVTVHIEGGTVQGYFDLTKNDADDDWAQMKTHLLTDVTNRPSVCLKTDKHVMNLGITRLINALNGTSMVKMLNVWRNLAEWEDELMGRTDSYGGQTTYGQYCNTLFSVTALPGTDGYPHCSNYGTYYYEYSDNSIFNADALLTVADNMWCIAHEQGHSRQDPINMAGNTEISNNLFSNMAIYKQGRYTSRTASIQETFRDFAAGMSWPERVAKACDSYGNYNQHILHLNWQLYLYFHVLGKDPDFFPRLFDALRSDPMTKVKSGSADNSTLTPADTDYLKYYVKCCQVSGYDLTEFFAAYGFFILPPERDYSITYQGVTTNRFQTLNDYGYYYLYATQTMIDNAKNQVANMNLPKCNIIFIEDRVSAPDALYEGHAEGETRTINPDSPVQSYGTVGELGQYTTFNATCSNYSYNVNDGVVTMEGTGAVGFIVYDSSGNIIGFYNTNTFTLPSGATNYTIKAAAGNGSSVSATYNSEVETFPKADTWYTFCSTLRGSRYVRSTSAGGGVYGLEHTTGTQTYEMMWKFVSRGDGSYDIINRKDNSYLNPVATYNTQITTTATRPSKGWTLGAASTSGMWIIHSGTVELNQTNLGATTGYKVYNWSEGKDGNDIEDLGCQFTIMEAIEPSGTNPEQPISDTALEELDGYTISVSSEAATSLSTGQWYVMFDRGGTSPYNHGYLYENVSSHTLYNTNTIPSGTATEACKYLVRLIDAGNGKYYIQTGYGNYFGQIQSSINVPVIATQTQRIIVAKIANTDGHFYLQGENGNVILDANNLSAGDATVVGYGTTVPTATGGNNDWAFYPVDLIDETLSSDFDLMLASSPTDDISTGTWYVMYNRGSYRGYLYEDNSSNKLYNTYTGEPGLVSSNSERFLVRLSDAGDGKYYIETGYGTYVQQLSTTNSSAATTGSAREAFTIAKIASTDGHFYVQGSNNMVLDANAAYSGDAHVVSYGTTVPTATGGNNDWAFYPVEMVEHFAPTTADIYTVNNTNSSRGALMSAPSQSAKWVWSSGKNSQTFDATSANCQWIFVPAETENQYYLYNVGKQKFIVPTKSGSWSNSNYTWMFSSDAVAFNLFLQSDGTYKLRSVSGSIYLSVSNNYTGPIINYNDVGAQFTVIKRGTANSDVTTQLTDALAVKPASSYTQTLNAVNGKSYATLYLDYDAQTDENTKAYYITETENNYAKLTEITNEGHNIPAYTAVVLVNENADTSVTFGAGFPVSSGYVEAIAEGTNLLKGTLTSMVLDLSDETSYYSLGQLNGRIGFYKFDKNGTTTITLGANKAYLNTTAPIGSVKGFLFDLGDDATGIENLNVNANLNDAIYNVAGQRLSKPQHGVNIINGKKVFIK